MCVYGVDPGDNDSGSRGHFRGAIAGDVAPNTPKTNMSRHQQNTVAISSEVLHYIFFLLWRMQIIGDRLLLLVQTTTVKTNGLIILVLASIANIHFVNRRPRWAPVSRYRGWVIRYVAASHSGGVVFDVIPGDDDLSRNIITTEVVIFRDVRGLPVCVRVCVILLFRISFKDSPIQCSQRK